MKIQNYQNNDIFIKKLENKKLRYGAILGLVACPLPY